MAVQAEPPMIISVPIAQDVLKKDERYDSFLPGNRIFKRTLFVLLILGLLYFLQQIVSPDLHSQSQAATGPICGAWQTTTGPRLSWEGDGGFNSISAISPNDVWVGGGTHSVFGPLDQEGAQPIGMHWDGKQWQEVSTPKPGDGSYLEAGAVIMSISGVAPNDVWAVGRSRSATLAMRWNGSSWNVIPSPNAGDSENDLFGVAAISANDAWAVGQYTSYAKQPYTINILIEHWNGLNWTVYNNPELGSAEGSLKSISVISASDIWAVGEANVKPLAVHWNGVKWRVVQIPGTDEELELNTVAAASSNDVWAAGQSYQGRYSIVHWDGAVWQSVQSSAPQLHVAFDSAVALAPDNVWMIRRTWQSSGDYDQDQRQLMRWDGKAWSEIALPTSMANAHLTTITKDAVGNVWLAGSVSDGKNKPSYSFVAHFTPSPCP